MHTIRQLLIKGNKALKAKYPNTYQIETRALLAHIVGENAEYLLRNYEEQIPEPKCQKFFEYIHKRQFGQPLSQIIGKREFWGLEFYINEEVLDPRIDSEVLIETALKYFDPQIDSPRILDLGTGSGCLALTLLYEFKNSNIVAVDICDKALKVARKNAISLGLEDRVKFVRSNWLDKVTGTYDLIISNPPYISMDEWKHLDSSVKTFEPKKALTDNFDGLTHYHAIISNLKDHMSESAIAVFEIGYQQKESVCNILASQGYRILETVKDLSGLDRSIVTSK